MDSGDGILIFPLRSEAKHLSSTTSLLVFRSGAGISCGDNPIVENMRGDEDLQARLQNALAECSQLREENARLQRLIPDPVSLSNQSPESTEGKHLDRNTATTSDLVRN